MAKALVLGFFDRGNYGDELYKQIYTTYLSQSSVQFTFVCIDDLTTISDDYDLLVLAGGDLVNHHFFNRLKQAGIVKFRGPKYAFSVGIPYDDPECINNLDMFDRVFLRSAIDYKTVSNRLGKGNVTIVPDFVTLLSREITPKPVPSSITTIAVCLARPICNNNPFYHYVVNRIAQGLDSIADRYGGVRFRLMPFNTNKAASKECDIYINREVKEMMRRKDRVTLEDGVDFSDVDFVIGMRYHSLILSIVHSKPFMAMYTTRKVRSLLQDLGRDQFGYDLDEGWNFNVDIFNEVFERAYQNLENPFAFPVTLPDIGDKLIAKVSGLLRDVPRRTSGAVYLDPLVVEKNLELCLERLADMLNVGRSDVPEALLETTAEQREQCARAIIYAITGSVESDCLWGLLQEIGRPGFSLLSAVKYITEEFYREGGVDPQITPVSNIDDLVKLNLTYMQQFVSKQQHRSGWYAVMSAMMQINDTGPSTMLMDTYVDRTFHWGQAVLKNVGTIPYRRPWVGVIHHTFDETHSKYNCVELLSNPVFRQSLRYCKTLIVLSEYLKEQLRDSLDAIGFSTVPIVAILHPTEFVTADHEFTTEKYLANTERCICQIGCWLRNPYAIYALQTSANKAALMGKNMGAYFRPTNLFKDIEKLALEANTSGEGGSSICRPEMCRSEDMCRTETVDGQLDVRSGNKYVLGMLAWIKSMDASVRIIERLDNGTYDQFLSRNIVFLNLTDVSACNTVIECLVRCTPCLVNRHPALQEYLGIDYPFFYDSMEEAGMMANDIDKIRETELYLRALDKTPLKMESFMKSLRDAILRAEF